MADFPNIAIDISADELNKLLKMFPIRYVDDKPTESTVGKTGETVIFQDENKNSQFYLCVSAGTNKNVWELIAETNPKDYVPKIRKVAGVDLADDVTAKELTTALELTPENIIKKIGVYPVIMGQGAPTTSTEGHIGQHYVDSKTEQSYICVKGGDLYVWREIDFIETKPSPNLVNINDTESYPYGISETEAVKGLYSWVDEEGYINIKGTTNENCSLFLTFDTKYTEFEPGTYYIGFDGVLGNKEVHVGLGDNEKTAVEVVDGCSMVKFTLTESVSAQAVNVDFWIDTIVNFRGHCWITKDEPIDFYVQKGGSYEDLEKFTEQVNEVINNYLNNYPEQVNEIIKNYLDENPIANVETKPSPNLVNINDTESWPFGISETEAVKGLYSWVDEEGYVNIKGTTEQDCSIFFMFEEGNIAFEPGTYYIGFDDVLRTGSGGVNIQFNGEIIEWLTVNDSSPTAKVTLTESTTVRKIDVYFDAADIAVNFRGHCWITKDEPIDFYVQKGGSYEVPIIPVQKEDLEKLNDFNILGIFNSIGGVGDSLMSGYINPTSDDAGSDTTCYDKSWLSHIKKILGVDIAHYSYQGATTKNWLENYKDFYDKILETPHEAYFLALGTNDAADWAGYGIGTIADMGTDTESFYGYYSKVISRIREANPKAPIFMLSYYWTGFSEYDNAIKAMSEATENAYYIDITDMNEKYGAYRQGYHFNAIGYYYISKSIIERVSEIIVKNAQDFANLGVSV